MAARFNGDGGRLTILSAPSTPWTMMGWCYIDTDTNAISTFFSHQDAGGNEALVQTNATGTTIGLYVDFGFRISFAGSTGTWYHYALSKNTSNLYTLWRNGSSQGTYTDATAGSRISIGDEYAGGGPLNGRVEGLKVWSRVLTQSEINAEMRSMRPTDPTSLWAWWPLISGITLTTDYSGNGRTLTQTGTVDTALGPPVSWGSRPIIFLPVGGGATTMPADSGSYTLTGIAAVLKQGYKVTADAGSYTMTGTAATLKKVRTMTASSGSFLVTGIDAALKQTIISTSSAGSFTVSGTAAALKQTRIMAADSGSFTVTGTAATLLISVTMPASSGSYTMSGTDATLRETVLLPAASGSYAVNGTAANLFKGKIITASSGSYTMTGTAATLKQTIIMGATAGSYSVNGTAASLLANEKIVADSGSYVVTGTAATLKQAKRLIADSGSYIVSGTAATLTYSAAPAAARTGGGMSAAKNTRRSRMRGR